MSVIVEFQVPAHEFELGRILGVEGVSSIELESLVPIGESTIPLFWIHNTPKEAFVQSIRRHPTVNDASEVDTFEDRILFTLDWDAGQDHVIQGIRANDGQVLSAVGRTDAWRFEVRFPDHEQFSAFTTHCEDAGISLEILRVYNPSESDAGPWYGLTDRQREAITLAVEKGYYDIPRGCTTKELAEGLDISDQAVTERLRRAIEGLVSNTLMPSEERD